MRPKFEQSSARPVTLYIGGTGRSGSTLLECLIAELPGVTVLGEVTHLWERGLVLDQLCACGQSFHTCEFWSEVGLRAFAGWENVDIERVRFLQNAVDRQRRMPKTSRRRPSRLIREQCIEYAEYYRKIYDAAAGITGSRLVVDSSKVPPTALALSHNRRIDLRILHLVRDSRGVAYSWSKQVPRPETRDAEDMPRYPASSSVMYWLSHNLSIGGLAHRGVPVHRIRYEDMLADLSGTLLETWKALMLPGSPEFPIDGDQVIELHSTHSVAGNPMRFKTGNTTLRRDDAWKEKMSKKDQMLVTAMSYPVLKKYRYI